MALNRLIRSSRTLLSSTKMATRGGGSQRNKTGKVVVDLEDEQITCLTLHPVTWPNHGAKIELGLASEALGLARSLDWEIIEGPTKLAQTNSGEESEPDDDSFSGRGRQNPVTFDHQSVIKQMRAEGIKDGDYVYAPNM